MLPDPQVVTINSIAISMPLVSSQATSSLYQSADGLSRLRISWTANKGSTRYLVRYEEDAIAADPITAVNKKVTASIYIVFEQPSFGISDARMILITAGLKTLLNTGAGLFVERILSNEH